MRNARAALLLAVLACQPTPERGAGPEGLPEPRPRSEACASHEPLRQAFFGDLHVHSAASMDAYVFGTRATPDDAYRFAQGAALEFSGRGMSRLERPLDFAAVSEHAEFIGETALCLSFSSEVYDHPRCRKFRGETGDGDFVRMSTLTDERGPFAETGRFGRFGWRARAPELCGDDGERCQAAMGSVWQDLQRAAAANQDESAACRFTTFNAYEWSWSPQLSKVHRNVVFRNEAVPALPLTAIEFDEPAALWRGLEQECLDAGTGCDVLTIPHNPNFSDGRLLGFDPGDVSPAEARELAALRARLEPLVEIMQVKGDSECAQGLPQVEGDPDPLCAFEKMRGAELPVCAADNRFGALAGLGCRSPTNYVRYALIEGLRVADRLGINPLALGITASTDGHDANPGDTEEYSFQARGGVSTGGVAEGLSGPAGLNPGGLMGVWSEENSRDALFDAMQRRETFGTSGVRIRPRLFGAWEMDDTLCGWPDHVARADARAVPMGAELPAREGGQAPLFLVSALRDPGTPLYAGNPLERIQIVKGQVGSDGGYRQSVHDVVVAEEPGRLDPNTCEVGGGGAHGLCAVWQDPDFDPETRAFYYARVVEVPSCRWNAWDCTRLREDERPAACSDPDVHRVVRERAWTSPIWYTPS